MGDGEDREIRRDRGETERDGERGEERRKRQGNYGRRRGGGRQRATDQEKQENTEMTLPHCPSG